MMKATFWICTLLTLSSCGDPVLKQTQMKVTRIYLPDAEYPTLPLTPLSPRF